MACHILQHLIFYNGIVRVYSLLIFFVLINFSSVFYYFICIVLIISICIIYFLFILPVFCALCCYANELRKLPMSKCNHQTKKITWLEPVWGRLLEILVWSDMVIAFTWILQTLPSNFSCITTVHILGILDFFKTITPKLVDLVRRREKYLN